MATQQEQQVMMAFVTASSLDAATNIVRQYPYLKEPSALTLLAQLMATAKQSGKTDLYNQFTVAHQRLAQIHAGR